MKQKQYLIADFGASSGRVLSAGYDGKQFRLEEIHRFPNRPVYAGDTLYWDFLGLLAELKEGIRKACNIYGNTVASIGIDTWGVDFGLLDEHGRLLSNPVHYRDGKRHRISEKLFSAVSKEDLFKVSGCFQPSIMGVFQLYALLDNGDTAFRNADSLLMTPDLFSYFLTGEQFNEASIAHTSLLYNVFTRGWDRELIERLGFSADLFNPVIQPGTPAGRISEDVAEELNIPRIPVTAPAGHDTASAFIGIPVEEDSGSWGFLSLGTWGVIGTDTEEPVMDISILDGGYGNEVYGDGKTFIGRNITGLWIIQQCRDCWQKQENSGIPWEKIIAEAAAAPPALRLIDVDEPQFAQVQPDMQTVINESLTATGQPPAETGGETSRCIFESLVCKFSLCFTEMEGFTGKRIRKLHLVGGGSRNELICGWTADCLNIPVTAGPVETTAAGNLLMQLAGTGEIATVEEGRDLIRRSLESRTYLPGETERWEEIMNKYRKIFGGSGK